MFGLVKPYHSSQGLLPPLSGQPGALLAVLRAALVTGAGVANVATLTVLGGVATATYASAHGYIPQNVLLMAGADQAAINGEVRVLSVPTPNSLTFSTSAADGSATGTITSRLAPAAWEEVFTGTNVAVFRPTAIGAPPLFLRVDDTNATYALVRCYEDMTDVNTGVNPIPTVSQVAAGLVWHKSNSASSVERQYSLFADAAGFYFCPNYNNLGTGQRVPYYVGKYRSFKAGDAWGWLVSGKYASSTTGNTEGSFAWTTTADRGGVYSARGVAGSAGAVGLQQRGVAVATSSETYSGTALYAGLSLYPNPADAGLLLCMVELIESGGVRGVMPGLYHARSAVATTMANGLVLSAEGALTGRVLMAMLSGSPASTAANSTGPVFFDLTDTWDR